MPQVVVVIDNRISCETILHDQDPNPENNNNNNNNNNKIDEDLPAESYFLAKEEEVEWIDRNAVFDRKDSDKAINYHQSTTVKISSHRHNNNTSQRFKSKPSIIGLPKPPPPPPPHPNTTLRRATATARFFPKRSSSSLSEPSSPKVSCIGRVRSRKCRHRKPHDSSSAGFWSAFRDALSLGCRKAQSVEVHDGSAAAESSEPAVGPPGLGGMNRFTSGRRSDAWPGDQGLRRGGPQEVC